MTAVARGGPLTEPLVSLTMDVAGPWDSTLAQPPHFHRDVRQVIWSPNYLHGECFPGDSQGSKEAGRPLEAKSVKALAAALEAVSLRWQRG